MFRTCNIWYIFLQCIDLVYNHWLVNVSLSGSYNRFLLLYFTVKIIEILCIVYIINCICIIYCWQCHNKGFMSLSFCLCLSPVELSQPIFLLPFLPSSLSSPSSLPSCFLLSQSSRVCHYWPVHPAPTGSTLPLLSTSWRRRWIVAWLTTTSSSGRSSTYEVLMHAHTHIHTYIYSHTLTRTHTFTHTHFSRLWATSGQWADRTCN